MESTATYQGQQGAPTHDGDAERLAVGTMLVWPGSIPEVAGVVRPSDFLDPELGRLCRRATEKHLGDFHPIEVAEAVLGEQQGLDFMYWAARNVPTGENASWYARRVKDAAQRRRVWAAARDAQVALNDRKPWDEVAADLGAELYDLHREGEVGNPFDSLPFDQFMAEDFSTEYFVTGVMAAGQMMVIGAPEKSLKTSIAVDLAISLASGTRFLNHFDVDRPVSVQLHSRESGAATLQDTMRRVVESRGGRFDPAMLHISTKLPKIDDPCSVKAWAGYLEAQGKEVVVLDPMYLLMPQDTEHSNLFSMGEPIAAINEAAEQVSCTPVIVHHSRQVHHGKPLKLADLAYSGLQQYARQWLLLNRRSEYQCDGFHELIGVVGGSAGHSGLYEINVAEGRQDDPGGRGWNPVVRTAQEAKKQRETAAEDAKAEKHRRDLEIVRKALKREGKASKAMLQVACADIDDQGGKKWGLGRLDPLLELAEGDGWANQFNGRWELVQ